MELDRECKDRGYCFGRLTAVYDRAETWAYGYKDHFQSMASQLQESGFLFNHPGDAVMKMEIRFSEVCQKLAPKTREYLRNEIEQIIELLSEDLPNYNNPLKPNTDHLFTQGYYMESGWLRRRNERKNENVEQEQ